MQVMSRTRGTVDDSKLREYFEGEHTFQRTCRLDREDGCDGVGMVVANGQWKYKNINDVWWRASRVRGKAQRALKGGGYRIEC
jgi:hypothetical protein